jgi:Fur family ferric uptake transcriptional regulator
VVVAVTLVRMMQVAADQEVDVIAVRYRLVSAVRSVRVLVGVLAAGVLRRAARGILIGHREHVLVDMVAVRMVQVALVEVVDMAVVEDGCVTAPRAVLMVLVVVDLVRHPPMIPPRGLRAKQSWTRHIPVRIPPVDAPRWDRYAHQRLASSGFRRGGGRAAVIELLAGQACALTAIEIEDALRDGDRKVARATVYRVLEELETLGVVARVEIGDGVGRYEPVFPDGAEHHHHLVCGGCGRLTPFVDDELERAIRRVAKREAFAIEDHDVTLHGACASCASAN